MIKQFGENLEAKFGEALIFGDGKDQADGLQGSQHANFLNIPKALGLID